MQRVYVLSETGGVSVNDELLRVWTDFVVDEGQERFCGVKLCFNTAEVWVFNEAVHGYDVKITPNGPHIKMH